MRSGDLELRAWRTQEGHLAFLAPLEAPGWLVIAVEQRGAAVELAHAEGMYRDTFVAGGALVLPGGGGVRTTSGIYQEMRMAHDPDAEMPDGVPHSLHGAAERNTGFYTPVPGADPGIRASLAEDGHGDAAVTVLLPEKALNLEPGTPVRVLAFRGEGSDLPRSPFLSEAATATGSFLLYPARADETASAAHLAAMALDRPAEAAAGFTAAVGVALAVAAGMGAAALAGGLAGVRPGSRRADALEAVFHPRPRGAARALLATVLLVAPVLVPGTAAEGTPDQSPADRVHVPEAGMPRDACDETENVRTYNVSAIHVHMIYNRFGDLDPHGMMYVLDEKIPEVRAEERRLLEALREDRLDEVFPTGAEPTLLEPLVLRVQKGECLQIRFTNRLDPGHLLSDDPLHDPTKDLSDLVREHAARTGFPKADLPPEPFADLEASVHVHGLPTDPLADGTGAVGRNPKSTVGVGETRVYRYGAPFEGTFYLHDHGDPTGFGSEQFHVLPDFFVGSVTHGLFGAVIVEPFGATWTDPFTGDPLASGWRADVHVPGEPSYREFAIFYHDPQITRPDGGEIPEPATAHALNYRVETLSHRLFEDTERCDEGAAERNRGVNPCNDISLVYSSVVHGDPGTPLPRAYLGDKVKFRIIGAGAEESHVHHIHGHRWRAVDESELSTRIDSQMVAPQETWTQTFESGAGGQGEPIAPGDYMYHCHLVPHLYGGMWGMFRVHDRLEEDLEPLPSEPTPPPSTPENPGFPENMIRAQPIGERPLRPPQEPGLDERTGIFFPEVGAAYEDPCPEGARERRYRLTTMEANILLNDEGDFVQDAVIYAFAEDAHAIESGEKNPDPVVLRLVEGECIVITLESRMPAPDLGEEPLPGTGKASIHTHLLQYSVLASDGTTTGWNYDQTIWPGEEITYRLYADVEARTVVWHGHTGPVDVYRGGYGATLVEPEGADWRNPETGGPIYTTGEHEGDGAFDSVRDPETGEFADVWRADILRPDAPDFREFFVSIQDHVPARRADGTLYRPQPGRFPFEDFGIMGFNYRSEPLWHRAYSAPMEDLFNSRVHGDPSTPMWEAYPGDPVVFRLHQVPYEELHSVVLDGHRWRFGQRDPFSPITDSFSVGITEQFNAFLECGAGGCTGTPGDYMYRGGAMDDLWPGAWGLFRVHDGLRDDLLPLPDRETDFEPDPVCPPDAPTRRYDIHAIQKESLYNAYGDHDPHGLAFVHASEKDAILAGVKRLEPLTLRVEEGACIKVRLTNDIPPGRIPHAHTDPQPTAGYVAPMLPPDIDTGDLLRTRPFEPGDRVGFHVHLLSYDIQDSGGGRVGFNRDTTVGPGETRTYTYYTDALSPMTGLIEDLGDIVTNRHHGLWGSFVVHPMGSTIVDPQDGQPHDNLPVADVLPPEGAPFRDAVLHQQSGIALWQATGRPFPTRDADTGSEEDEVEDDPDRIDEPESAARRTVAFLEAFAEREVKVTRVRHADPGFLVEGTLDGKRFRARVDLLGEVRDVELAPHRLDPPKIVRLTDEAGVPFVGVKVVVERPDGAEVEFTNARGVAVFDHPLIPETLHPVRVPGAGLRIPVRAGFDGGFRLDVRADVEHFAEATEAARRALQHLKDHHFPPAPPGVSGVDVTGDVWRVDAEDALRTYTLQIDPGTGEVVDFLLEARATPTGPPAFIPRKDIVTAARTFLEEHGFGPVPLPIDVRRDRFATWRVEFSHEGIATSLRLDGQTARVLKLVRAPGDAFRTDPALPEGPVGFRARVEGVPHAEGALVLVFRDGQLTGQFALQSGGRTVFTNEMLGHATGSGEADVKIPVLGIGFPIEIREDGRVEIDVGGTLPTTNVGPMIALREAVDFFTKLDARPRGAEWGLTGLELKGDGTWEVSLATLRFRLDVFVDSGTGEVRHARLRAWVTPEDNCSSQPLEHFGPHSPPACPTSFSFVDEEDQGARGYNYRSEPYRNRFLRVPDPALVYSTRVHREPATPILNAHPHDPFTIHLVGVEDKGRMGSFSLSGHTWSQNPFSPETLRPRPTEPPLDLPVGLAMPTTPSASPFTTGALRQAEGGINFYRIFTLDLVGGAGGPSGLPGDYLYQGAVERYAAPMGEWGILRVHGDGGPVRTLADPPGIQRGTSPAKPCTSDEAVRLDATLTVTREGRLDLTVPPDQNLRLGVRDDTVRLRVPADGATVVMRLVDEEGHRVVADAFTAQSPVPWVRLVVPGVDSVCLVVDPPLGDTRATKIRLVATLDGTPAKEPLEIEVMSGRNEGVPGPLPWEALLVALALAVLLPARRARRR